MSGFPHGQNVFNGNIKVGMFGSVGASTFGDLNPIPANMTLSRLSVHASSAPVANKVIQPEVGGVASGSAVTLLSGTTDVAGALSAVVPQTTSLATAATNGLILDWGGGTFSVNARFGLVYVFASPFQAWQMFGSGESGNANLGFTNTDVFQAIGSQDQRIAPENQVQLQWNVPGTFKYFLAYCRPQFGVGLPATVNLRFRVNAATAIQLSPSVNGETLVLDTTTSVHVNSGDFINFAGNMAATIANIMNLYFAIGFLPD
jgi:hypothetical protein